MKKEPTDSGSDPRIPIESTLESEMNLVYFNTQNQFHSYLEASFGGLMKKLGEQKELTPEIEKELNKELGPFFIAGLYRIIFQLGQEQRDWLSDEVIEKAKK